ncbi:MAG: lipopolysaccharide heptosyltransferase II [Leptospira sp.]|nr:lipopolysaccharide heptosyltransferase II [Leptospira sp.]
MKNILIIQTAFLGDLILTTPFIREVKRQYPDSRISIIVNKGTEEVLNANPILDEVICFDKKKVKSSLLYFISFIRNLRNKKFVLCLSPHFSHRSSILSFLSGAKERIGYKESGFSFLHSKKISRPLRGMHEVDKLFSLIADGPENFPVVKRPELYFPKEILPELGNLLQKMELIPRNYIIVSPSSVWETKRMPQEKFKKLISVIRNNIPVKVVLTGSAKDYALCESIRNGFDENVINLSGKTNLTEMSFLIKNAKVVISNDSSPVHFASAHNVPVLEIYGATVPEFGYGPLSEKSAIAEINGLYCRPCKIHGGNSCPEKHFRCMMEQVPENLFRLVEKIIS